MKINLRITYADGSAVDTAATTADLVAFEEHFSRSIMNLEAELRFTDICWLAWHSQRRKDQTAIEFHPWLETLDGVELSEGEVTPSPLEPTASTSA